jgi:NADPH2:quinone reductase
MAGTGVAQRMRAWQVREVGEPADVLAIGEVAVPTPGPGEVLVEVWATALNFPDVLMVQGKYQLRPPVPFVPGIEMCGLVVAAGPGVSQHVVGDRVIGMPRPPHGSLARYAIAANAELFPAPPGLDDVPAAALHVAYQTAWFALNQRAGLRVGQTLLVTAAAGGVGSATVQLGKAIGARVIGVVGSQAKAETAKLLGCDTVIDRSSEDVVDAVRNATGGRGVDVVVDMVGGDSYTAATKVVAFGGKIVVVGFTSGQIPQPGLNHALLKNYSIIGLHWGRYLTEDPALVARCHTDLTRLVDVGAVRPFVSEELPFEEAGAALVRLATGDTVGRIVVHAPA